MGQGTTLFLLGVIAFQQLPQLPNVAWGWLLPVLVVAARCHARLRWPAWFAGGFLWTLLHAHLILASGLAPELEGRDLLVEGVIVSIPEHLARGTRFEFHIDSMTHEGEAWPSPGRVRLSWYQGGEELHAGEHWRLQVRLRRPHGFANPGGFDYEAWLLRKQLRATGYVRGEEHHRRLDEAGNGAPLQRLRQYLGQGIADSLERGEFHGIVTALAIGDRQGILQEQWEIFRRTGTSHLIAISGLHIGLVAGMVFFALRWAWSRCGTLAARLPAPQAAAVAAILAALVYAALAGFSIPTRRALIMICIVMAAILWQRQRSLRETLMAALLGVLILDPLAVMDGGFWLSFCAVATILFGMSLRVGAGGWWWRWGRLHVLVTIGLAPVLILLFQQLPLVSPLANFIAVPWVSVAVVPLVLLGTLLLTPLPAAGGMLLWLADRLLALLWPVLASFAASDHLQWTQHTPPGWALAAAAVGVILLLAPRGVPGRACAVLWLMPAVLLKPGAVDEGAFRLTLLDVGQGLAAVVRTRDHVLVYDTGARFSPGFDAGSAVLLPYLRHQGVTAIDTLVISHDDNDHIGGAAALAGTVTVRRVISGMPASVPWWPASDCHSGAAWRWDGVDFEILHPPRDTALRGNDLSCVLRIGNGNAHVLLTGDIEARSEATLLTLAADRLGAEILVAPHHGSRTSSSPSFIAAVAPVHVLVPAGYRNRWNHPHPEIVERYRASGASVYETARHGAIVIDVPAGGAVPAPRSWRQYRARYWHHR